MTDLYPVFLRVEGRVCLVVGGGNVALRKTRGLLPCGATVRVVSPRLCSGLETIVREGKAVWREGGFQPSDLDGAILAFAATSDVAVNRRVLEEGAIRGVWVNVADDPDACHFHVPAVTRRGDLAVAVATGGASPALAGWLRDRLSGQLPDELCDLMDLLRTLRGASQKSRWQAVLESGVLEDLMSGNREALHEKLARLTGATAPGVSTFEPWETR